MTAKDHHEQNLLDLEPSAKPQGPVDCLGITFENDEERREYFLEKLREKLKDPEFRKIEGFPIGKDDDILALSDPPYYTACPNPFIEDFIKQHGKPYDPDLPYSVKPFAADVSEGKGDPIYRAHSYHTKVPHKAIMRYILHYTEPGDTIFDGFCGSGMTGVAAQLCGDKVTIELLGYRVSRDGLILQQETNEEGKTVWQPFSRLGARRAILNDLSPAATFISYNYNAPIEHDGFKQEATRIQQEVEEDCGWMFKTLHGATKEEINLVLDQLNKCETEDECREFLKDSETVRERIGRNKSKLNLFNIHNIIWSDVFSCPECGKELVFWKIALDFEKSLMNGEFPCPSCSVLLIKKKLERFKETLFDNILSKTIVVSKMVPSYLVYHLENGRTQKAPDLFDLGLIEKTNNVRITSNVPNFELPKGFNTKQPKRSHGFTHVHHFYTNRNFYSLGKFAEKSNSSRYKSLLIWQLDSNLIRQSKLSRLIISNFFHGGGGWIGGPISGTLFVPSFSIEVQPFETWSNRTKKTVSGITKSAVAGNTLTYTCSASFSGCKKNSIDYIFLDPPFGGNIMYSELNSLWEAWKGVVTNNKPEAIVNKEHGKDLFDYQTRLLNCFREAFRVLKPGRWMTIEFSNTKASIWNVIQNTIQEAGFIIANVSTLDKKQGSFKAVTTTTAVKQDLIISAYKPNEDLEELIKLKAGTEEGVWDFIRTHLKQLPVFISKDGHAEVIAERQNYLLFDRMVAFYVQRYIKVPLSAAEFYAGLEQRFPPRDGMYFLSNQAAEYDKKRMSVKEVLQLQLFISDEASAIQWLKQQLTRKPQTFQDIHPQFMKELGGWHKHEKALELSELLKENFLPYDGTSEVPSQIHSYLSTNFKDLRNIPKDHPKLCAKGKDRWYVADPKKAGDLEKLRERTLLREFEEYRESEQKRLKVFRLEAVRAGFKRAWHEHDYATIIAVADKIPENVLHEDPHLIMWYDHALTRTET